MHIRDGADLPKASCKVLLSASYDKLPTYKGLPDTRAEKSRSECESASNVSTWLPEQSRIDDQSICLKKNATRAMERNSKKVSLPGYAIVL